MEKELIKILYIDDEKAALFNFKQLFQDDFEVLTALSAAEGFEILADTEVQIIISDQRMPNKTGIEFFAEVAQLYPDTIRILLTAYSEAVDIIDAINLGHVYQYITKPFETLNVKNILDKASEQWLLKKSNDLLIAQLKQKNEEYEAINNKLTESETQYRNLANSGTALIWQSGIDKLVFYYNEPWLNFTGRTLEQEYGNGWEENVHPVDFNQCLSTYVNSFDNRVPYEMEYRMRRADGEYRWILELGNPNYNSVGEFIGYIGHCFDINESKKVKDALQESEERFKLLFDKAPLGYQSLDINGCFIDINQKWLDMLGYTQNEVVGKWFGDFMPPKFQELVKINFPKFKKQGFIYSEFELIHKNGDILYIAFDGKIGHDLNGNFKQTHCILQDITESKRAKDALIESERRFRELLSNVQMISVLLDLDGNIIFCNDYLLSITGWKMEEVVGKNWFKTFLPSSIYETVLSIYKDAIENQNVILHYENAILTKNGHELIVSWNNTVLFDEKGSINGIASLGVDITEKVKSESELKESEFKFRTVANFTSDWEYWQGKDKEIIFMSPSCLSVTGYTREEFIANPKLLQKIIHSDDVDTFNQHLHNEIIVNTDSNKAEINFRIINKQGEIVNIQHICRPIYDKNNNFLGRRVSNRDITEQKKAEIALRESEEKLSALFNGMTEMTVIHELIFDDKNQPINYRIIDCNQAFSKITGIESEKAVGKLATEVYGTETAPYLEEYSSVCLTNTNYNYQTFYQPMDKYFLISAIPLDINRFATITTDITDIEKAKEIVFEKNKELENLIYVASHDLRSPLVNIQGFSQRLEKHTTDILKLVEQNQFENEIQDAIDKITNDEIPKSLGYIMSNITKMESLINGLLKLSRTGRILMSISEIDMNSLFQSIINTHQFEFSELHAQVEIESLSNCYGDENQLNQLFSNIIANAIKYRDLNRRLSLRIYSKTHSNKVVYAITDNGIGINNKYLPKIWDIFYRVNPEKSETGEGLGLSVARKITEKHKGKIWVESEPGIGSTFYVELMQNKFEE